MRDAQLRLAILKRSAIKWLGLRQLAKKATRASQGRWMLDLDIVVYRPVCAGDGVSLVTKFMLPINQNNMLKGSSEGRAGHHPRKLPTKLRTFVIDELDES